ncbi:stage V sporulation protein D [Aneurinibacillus thermoaerophilus]|uniref:Stage V sporulation protein D (Sporulation-specific penicillin-binding protein) n=1 Tax=Aneurinibacillus thermoaerophilus TaxID=143495 RepID=A0A1G7WAM5_ANETH|nr:stage V sporulation protein D [Aneurinibacillus thermoaerophilus]MED0680210.1 stage V sporulation protein D [Aneurinibacillus thermoaerophilus]MED0756682.1 stage V sporulation protein D [Aneurinibacillus thermoaerophilus]MED0760732.1 stage V sporulation protein D [Aneurinibacillus thermoaerophilus]MED0764652.1 stage V sporulation protein D [Aneurinibacillus thermoaerophilus]SDG68140.1 stage V sporulation protein D (sporulation-specific penicillin-binding protein) [Aneurinibacillus thermoaer
MRVSGVTVRRRIFIAMLLGFFMFLLLITRLGYVQLWKGSGLTDMAEELWTRNIPFEAKRGRILDRNGEVLAYNISVPSVLAIPAQIKDKSMTARKLAQVLKGNEKEILKKISQRQLIVRVPGGRRISPEVAKQVQALNLPGIQLTEDSQRYYPRGAFLSHVLGFTGVDNQGLTGIERVYDEQLKGKWGYISFGANAAGQKMPGLSERFTPPEDGKDLHLTIDANIQAIIERELDQAMVVYQPDDALAIAYSPKTGEVLGMASRPNYDPGRYKEYPVETYNRNLPIWKTYEPGSTFKIITLAAALEDKKVDLDKDTFNDPGFIKVAGATLRCWKRGGHGHQTFLEGVENSCNPGFVLLGQRLGKERLFHYIKEFGFGKRTGIDLLGEENGVLFSLNRVGPVELATTAFGQGVSVTPIQQVAAVGAAINGGKLMKPYIAKAWYDSKTGKMLEENKPKVVRQVISPETSANVRRALESVVANGTGRNAYIDGYRVGGKTGTAQVVENGVYSKNKHIVSFIGFAPADDPQIIVYTAINNPKGIQFGGRVAAPIVRNILDSSLRYMKVLPRTQQMEKEYQYTDKKIVQVPNLIGMERKDITGSYYSFPLDISGRGSKVTYQSPQPGTRVEEGSTIRVYLGDK